MKREDLFLIWLNIQGLTIYRAKDIFEKLSDFDAFFDENKVKNAFFGDENYELIMKFAKLDKTELEKKIEDDLYNNEVNYVTYFSNEYSKLLKNVSDAPLVLYYKGNIKLLNEKAISIVGTRRPTTYGRIVCEKFTKELSESGLVTISGLAYGIDTLVAESTLSVNGKTIAVLAGGLDSIYPSQNTSLSKKIVQNGGLLISEYYIGVKPLSFHFISRNRIVAGIGLGLLIVEAGKVSGTMTTAKFALDQSKELFVIPGNITSPQSEGTNNLIDELPDTFTLSTGRILYRLGVTKKDNAKSTKQVDMSETKILSALEFEEMSFDALCDKTGLSPSELSSKLIKLEMFGLVKKGNGNTYYKM